MSSLYEKQAILGAVRAAWGVARPAVSMLGAAAKGSMGLGLAEGASRGMQAAHTAGAIGQAGNTAYSLYQSMKPVEPPKAPVPRPAQPAKLGSLDERLVNLTKVALDPATVADIASYGAFIGAKLLPESNPWHARLDALGLAGLGATTAYGMTRDPAERKPGAKDLAGLALMAWALKDRVGHH